MYHPSFFGGFNKGRENALNAIVNGVAS